MTPESGRGDTEGAWREEMDSAGRGGRTWGKEVRGTWKRRGGTWDREDLPSGLAGEDTGPEGMGQPQGEGTGSSGHRRGGTPGGEGTLGSGGCRMRGAAG